MRAFAIMPAHAYKDIKPEALRSHVASTWLGSYTVKTSDGQSFTARGAVGRGAVAGGRGGGRGGGGPGAPGGLGPGAQALRLQAQRGLLEAAYRQRQDVL